MLFSKLATALYTPFSEKGINFEYFDNLLSRQLQAKVDAVVILGTTGEPSTINQRERTKIIKFAVSRLKGKIPIIVGTGSNCTLTACNLTQQAKNLKADGALIVTPYYNKCEQEGLYLHYKEIATYSKFPIICYNVPSRTGVNINPETAKLIADIPYIVGFKEASSNREQIENLFTFLDGKKPIYCGNDHLLGDFIKLGCEGIISVASNVIPLKIKEYISDFEKDYENTASKFKKELLPFLTALTKKVNPIPIKMTAEFLYGEICRFRLPLCKASDEYYEYLKSVLNKLSIE